MELRWISVRETSQYLGIHEITVRRLIDRGEIFAAKVGRSVRIDKIKLDEKLERGLDIEK